MRTYTNEELIRTQLKSVSVNVSLGEINSENKKGACKFFCCKGILWKGGETPKRTNSKNNFWGAPRSAVNQRGRERKGPPEIIQKFSSADFPMTPMERTEHHFGPFWEKDFGAISGGPFFSRPLCFTADKTSLPGAKSHVAAGRHRGSLISAPWALRVCTILTEWSWGLPSWCWPRSFQRSSAQSSLVESCLLSSPLNQT